MLSAFYRICYKIQLKLFDSKGRTNCWRRDKIPSINLLDIGKGGKQAFNLSLFIRRGLCFPSTKSLPPNIKSKAHLKPIDTCETTRTCSYSKRSKKITSKNHWFGCQRSHSCVLEQQSKLGKNLENHRSQLHCLQHFPIWIQLQHLFRCETFSRNILFRSQNLYTTSYRLRQTKIGSCRRIPMNDNVQQRHKK